MNLLYLNFNRVIQCQAITDNTVTMNERSFILGFVDDLGNRKVLNGGYLTPFEAYVQNDDVDVQTIEDYHFSSDGRSFTFLDTDLALKNVNVSSISKKQLAIQNAIDLTGNPELFDFNYEALWISSNNVGFFGGLFGQMIYKKAFGSVLVHKYDKLDMISQYVELVGGPVDDILSLSTDGMFFFSGVTLTTKVIVPKAVR